jgi:hypothetical protein
MNESNIGGVSVRAIIVLFLVLVFTITVFTSYKNDVLNSLVMAAVGWYFGQKTPSNGPTNTDSSPTQDAIKK